MGPIFWAFLAGIGVAGYYGYRKLHAMEQELRREVAEEKWESEEEEGESTGPPLTPQPETAGANALKERLLERVREQPGILQTDLYGLYPEENRRTLQELLRKLDREGRVARTKEKGSYRLYPVQ